MHSVITWITSIIWVVSCAGMVAGILLHSGRGGGLSDMFGGGMGASAAGSTVMERNLDRVTVMVAIMFMFTSITLVIRLQ